MAVTKTRCACGVHVHTATRAIAITFLALNLVSLVQYTWANNRNEGVRHITRTDGIDVYRVTVRESSTEVPVWILLVSVAVSFAIYGGLLYGNVKKIALLYWPFMISHVLSLFLTVVLVFIMMFSSGAALGYLEAMEDQRGLSVRERNMAEQVIPAMSLAFLVAALIILLVLFVQFYLLIVVVRDYKFVKEEALAPENYDKLNEQSSVIDYAAKI